MIGATFGLIKGGFDAYRKFQLADQQEEQANKLKYQDITPASVLEALTNQRMAVNANMPGYNDAMANVNAGTNSAARALAQTTSGGSMLGGLQQQAFARNRALQNLAAQNANFRVGQQGRLNSTLGLVGQYQEQGRQQFNRAKAALKQASITNREGGYQDIGNSAVAYGQDADARIDQLIQYATGGMVDPMQKSKAPAASNIGVPSEENGLDQPIAPENPYDFNPYNQYAGSKYLYQKPMTSYRGQ